MPPWFHGLGEPNECEALFEPPDPMVHYATTRSSEEPMIERFAGSALVAVLLLAGCAAVREAKPLPVKVLSAYPNATEVFGALVAAEAYPEPAEAKEAFGFDVLGAGILPIQAAFDNRGETTIAINGEQTFLEDAEGRLWSMLSREAAHERATAYAGKVPDLREGTIQTTVGAFTSAVVGAAVAVVTGGNVGLAIQAGAAGGATGTAVRRAMDGGSDEARRLVIQDLQSNALQSAPIAPGSLAYGFLFFPGEVATARRIRLQLQEVDSGRVAVVVLDFEDSDQ